MDPVDDDLIYAKKKIELARVDLSEVSPAVQSLKIKEDRDDLRLIQLNADLLKQIEEGQILTIRGHPDESAVICTDSATYELKEAETSNSLLLLPDMLWPEECESGELRIVPVKICSIFHNYLEPRHLKPNFKKLRVVLEVNAYRGKEYEEGSNAKNYAFDDLLDVIQCSREELREGLNTLQACVIDGYVRILDFDYKYNVLTQLVDVIVSKSLPFNKIPKDLVIESLEDIIPKEIIENFFLWFACETDAVDENEQKFYTLAENSVCRMYAEVLLRSSSRFHLSEFLESWQKSVPEGMTCDLLQLQGLALTDRNYSPEAIFHFPSEAMPENISDRFTKLFKTKDKWKYEEIVPYLEDKTCAGTDVKSLLIKYTRESTRDGVKLYSSKW